MRHEEKNNQVSYYLEFDDNGHNIQIKIPTIANDLKSKLPHVIYFTGFGEQRVQALTAALKPYTTAGFKTTAVGLPFDKISLKAADWILDEGINTLINNLRHRNEKIILSGYSRGAAVAVSVFCSNRDKYEGLILLSPLGLIKITSKKYLFRNVIDSINIRYCGMETFKNMYGIVKEMINHVHGGCGGLLEALEFAMNQQYRVSRGVKLALRDKKILGIFIGSEDKVFRVREIKQALHNLLEDDSYDDILHIVKGNHAPVASKIGQKQLTVAASWLKSKY